MNHILGPFELQRYRVDHVHQAFAHPFVLVLYIDEKNVFHRFDVSTDVSDGGASYFTGLDVADDQQKQHRASSQYFFHVPGSRAQFNDSRLWSGGLLSRLTVI